MRKSQPGNPSRSGFTLVEVAWSCLLLAVLGLGSGAFVTFSQKTSEVLTTKRVALEAASSRLEDIRGSRFSDIAPVVQSYTTNYLSRSGSSWTRSAGQPNETVRLNGRNCSILTSIQYVDCDGGTVSYDCVRVVVNIAYGPAAADQVVLETVVAP